MAEQFTGDFHVVGTRDGSEPITAEFNVYQGAAATVAAGDLVAVDGSQAGYIIKAADGYSSDNTWVGMAVSASTEGVSTNGTVQVMYSPAGLIVRGVPTTPGSLAVTILNTAVTLDVTVDVQTVDETDTTKGVLRVVRYDSTNSTIDVDVPFQL